MMKRRDFMRRTLLAAGAGMASNVRAEEGGMRVMTVRGAIPAAAMGVTLVHEHVLVDFAGADKASPERYDPEEVFRVARPHLERVKGLGCDTLVDCTPAYLGRDPALLRRLSGATGLNILTNTGYYGAGDDRFLPEHARTETANDLARRWTAEWERGIGGTGVRPGFVKIGVDSAPLSEVDRKLAEAAALTHLASGLVIASHTGSAAAALEQLALLRQQGVSGDAFVWVHAQSEPDIEVVAHAAGQGAWLEFDGIAPETLGEHVRLVLAMQARGRLDQVLVSQDAGWYNVGQPGGGAFRPYDTLQTRFIPALKDAGLSEAEVRRLMEENPRRAFAVRVRSTEPQAPTGGVQG